MSIREKYRKTKHPNKRRKISYAGIYRAEYTTPAGISVCYELTLHNGKENHAPYGMLGAYYKSLRSARNEAAWYKREFSDKYTGYTITRIYVDEDLFCVDFDKHADIETGSFKNANAGIQE